MLLSLAHVPFIYVFRLMSKKKLGTNLLVDFWGWSVFIVVSLPIFIGSEQNILLFLCHIWLIASAYNPSYSQLHFLYNIHEDVVDHPLENYAEFIVNRKHDFLLLIWTGWPQNVPRCHSKCGKLECWGHDVQFNSGGQPLGRLCWAPWYMSRSILL